jgi:hypothetical protein
MNPHSRFSYPALLFPPCILTSSIRRTIRFYEFYASVLFFLILRPARCDFRVLCRVFSLSVEEWDMGRMLVWEEQRGGVSTWSVLSLVALVDPDTSNSDDDLHKGRLVKHEMTYPTPLASFNIHAAVSRLTQGRRYSCTVSSLVRRVQQHREPNSEDNRAVKSRAKEAQVAKQRVECVSHLVSRFPHQHT